MPVARSVLTSVVTSLVTSVVAGIAVVATAAPASADTEQGRDAARDVRSRGLYVDTPPRTPEPGRRLGDIVRFRATYGAALVVTTKYRDLSSRDDREFTWFLRTADDEFDWYSSLVVPAGTDKGTFSLIDPVANQPGCGRAVLDRSARTVTLRIPTSCLGDPAWVRVGHGAVTYTDKREYADDARREGVRGVGAWRYGPKLARG